MHSSQSTVSLSPAACSLVCGHCPPTKADCSADLSSLLSRTSTSLVTGFLQRPVASNSAIGRQTGPSPPPPPTPSASPATLHCHLLTDALTRIFTIAGESFRNETSSCLSVNAVIASTKAQPSLARVATSAAAGPRTTDQCRLACVSSTLALVTDLCNDSIGIHRSQTAVAQCTTTSECAAKAGSTICFSFASAAMSTKLGSFPDALPPINAATRRRICRSG